MDTKCFLKNICGSLFKTTVELRDKFLSPKLINLYMLIATEPCKHTFVSFNDSNKKTLLNRNEEMNENKEHFGDLVGFFWKKIKKG